MCSKCGVKLQPYSKDDDILIEICPICKSMYLTILSIDILKMLREIHPQPKKALLILLEEAMCQKK